MAEAPTPHDAQACAERIATYTAALASVETADGQAKMYYEAVLAALSSGKTVEPSAQANWEKAAGARTDAIAQVRAQEQGAKRMGTYACLALGQHIPS